MNVVSSQSILKFVERLEQENVAMHGFELRLDGMIRAEGYYAPFNKGEMHRMYSVSKTVTGLGIGLLVGEGKLKLTDHIADFFTDYLPAHSDPRLMRLTIHDMLRMATCHRKTTYREYEDYNFATSFFTTTPTHEPGTMFNYDTSCSQVLAELCERLSGQKLLDFLGEKLFGRIGANDPKTWITDPSGVPQGGTGLMMSLRDMGKVAQLLLDGGRDILPADYVAAMLSKQSHVEAPNFPEEAYGYGYQLWMTRNGWTMYGLGGQLTICVPKLRMIMSTIGDTRMDPYGIQRIHDAFQEEIVGHVNELELPGSAEKLRRKLADLRMVAVPHAGGELPQENRIYVMDKNESGFQRLVVGKDFVRVVWSDVEHEFRWDVLGQNRKGLFPHSDCPTLTSAGMTTSGALQVRCCLIGRAPCGIELFIHEKGGTVSVRMRKAYDPYTNRYEGIFWGRA